MILYFDQAVDAKIYKSTKGCGGWIFQADNGTAALFPLNYTPSMIFTHAVTHGQSGKLV